MWRVLHLKIVHSAGKLVVNLLPAVSFGVTRDPHVVNKCRNVPGHVSEVSLLVGILPFLAGFPRLNSSPQ